MSVPVLLSHGLGGDGHAPGDVVPGLPVSHAQVELFAATVGLRGQRARAIIAAIHSDPSIIGASGIEWLMGNVQEESHSL